ncbi:hypothetical protein [Clostridium pasteurianum]|uniref:hypothetical protein n=1 Tax=Clostridium pasteurianum TaxID=1501 RepID=UPI0005A27401|nr:hypothetical protein [Clostridium pasteurianum]
MIVIHYARVRLIRILYGDNPNIELIISEHKLLLDAIKNKKSSEYIEAVLRQHFMKPMEESADLFEKLAFNLDFRLLLIEEPLNIEALALK